MTRTMMRSRELFVTVGQLTSRVLKYTRIKNRIPEILGRDMATAIDVSPRVIVRLQLSHHV